MAWIPLAAMAAGTVLSAVGNKQQADASQAAANFSADQDELQAAQTLDAARQTAQKIRRAGNSTASTADASYAASGVRVDVGSPTTVGRQIFEDSESDALAALMNGRRQANALRNQAALARATGQYNQNAAQINTAGTVLSSVGRAYGKWGNA